MKIQAKDIQVGDLVYIKCDESIPADILVLSTSLQNGMCFIETVQLDGYNQHCTPYLIII